MTDAERADNLSDALHAAGRRINALRDALTALGLDWNVADEHTLDHAVKQRLRELGDYHRRLMRRGKTVANR